MRGTLGVALLASVAALTGCATAAGPGGPDLAGSGSAGGGTSTSGSASGGASGSGTSEGNGSGTSEGNGSGTSEGNGSGATTTPASGSDDSDSGSDGPSDAGESDDIGVTSPSSGSPAGTGGSPTMLPAVSGTCPTITPGASATMLQFAGEPVEIWAGKGGGPLVMYWFPTTGNSSYVLSEFGQANIDAVTAEGGMVASFNKSNGKGTDTGDAVWFTGDFDTADQVVACAIQQLKIDTRQIFVTGASAGGLQTTWMSYVRSGYIAAAVSLSGGLDGLGGAYLTPTTLEDPTAVPSIMAVHGKPGEDVVIIDFSVASAAWEADIAKKKGFSMDCNTEGGHVSGPPAILPGMWQFMKDHPFKVVKQPYPPIPSVYPSYCQIGPRAADGGVP